MSCINTNTKEFKELKEVYGVSKSELELAMYAFENNAHIEDSLKTSDNLKRWLDNYFNISTNNQSLLDFKNENQRNFDFLQNDDYLESLYEFHTFYSVIEWIKDNNLTGIVKAVPTNELGGYKLFAISKFDDISDFYNPVEIDNSIMEQSKMIVDKIIQDAKDHVVKDEKNHIYYIDGKPADVSVTQYIHGNKDLGKWGLPASTLGNVLDSFVRDYFNNDIKSSYPNLSKEDINNLINDLDAFSSYYNSTYGVDGWKVVSEEFPIYSNYTEIDKNGNPVVKTMAGTMDLFIYTNDGKFHILDVKTFRSTLSKEKLEGYEKQVNIYASILEAKYTELKGNIERLGIVALKQSYPNPNNEEYTNVGNELFVNGTPLVNNPQYNPARLLLQPTLERTSLDINFEYNQLSKEDRDFMEETKGTYIVESTKNVQSKEDKEMQALFNNPLLLTEEIQFLSDFAVKSVSRILNHLQTNKEAGNTYFGKDFNKDYTNLSRQEIIDTIGLGRIFNYVKENYFNPENIQNAEELDFDTLDKYQLFYDNWNTAIKTSYGLLIKLEKNTLVDIQQENTTKSVTENNEVNDIIENTSLEEGNALSWQVGHQQISAHSSLSQEIRRALDIMEVTDAKGTPVLDKYGFGLPTFVEADEAVNFILDWVQPATSIEEMESVLRGYSEQFPWVNGILEKVKEEPFRSKFFKNFYKNFTTYSTVIVENNNGVKTFKTKIINVKSNEKKLIDDASNMFNTTFNSSIQYKNDKGEVLLKEQVIKDTIEWVKKKNNTFIELFKTRSITSAIKTNPNIISDISKLYNTLGLSIDADMIKNVIRFDDNSMVYGDTKISKILNNLNTILEVMASNTEVPNYNPITDANNAKNGYQNSVKLYSKFLAESAEASTFEAGKMYYSYTNPSYLGKLMKNLSDKSFSKAKFNTFINREFGQYKFFKSGNTWNNEWLRLLATSPKNRELFRYKNQLTFDKTAYTELDETGYTLSLMSEYFSDPTKKTAWYRVPTLSNKPASEFIKFIRYGDSRYKENITDNMTKVFAQEIMRIKTVIERVGLKDGKIKNFDISKLDSKVKERFINGTYTIEDLVSVSNSGVGFTFMTFLNDELSNKTKLGNSIFNHIKYGNEDLVNLNKLVGESFNNYMDVSTQISLDYWNKIGLFDTVDIEKKNKEGNTVKDTQFINFSHLGKTKEEIESNLTNYLWNDYFATINIIQLTVTDTAYYGGIEDFQKRYSQIYAPGLRLNISAKDSNDIKYSSDGNSRTIYIEDLEIESEIKDKVKTILNNKLNSIKDANKKADFKKMIDVIVSSFDSVNVTDAQAYSSPTSYRKKMGMYGEWDTKMEEAYNKIKSGNYDINDLGVVWQPLKPFVYSQINKATGVDTMSSIKVPIQNKNSEYMLLLADALIRGGKENSKLTAIFDFMEMSAYDGSEIKNGEIIKKGTYNGKGIDTVQFKSAVKSGLSGVIDINDLNTEEDIINELNSKTYFNTDKSATVDNNWDVYNQDFVHTFSFEDYAIQQEVPAHLLDHNQLMGSQFRILSITDMSKDISINIDGNNLNREEIVNRYQNLVADNIKESFEDLKKEFKLDGTRLEQNKALSKILEDAILNDAKMGFDLLRSVKLDNNGEFTIPLNDTMQSIRIQQLLNSIIKSRINKQKVKGGPVVQTSVFGFSEDLKVVFKEDSSLDYYEAYMPIYDSELEKLITKEDGSLMSIEEAIEAGIMNEEMTKAMAYRI